MPSPRTDGPYGFTLVELMAALALASLVFLGVRTLLNQLADAGERIEQETLIANESANGEQLLAALLYHVEAMEDSHATDNGGRFSFTGDPAHASFTSWCEMPSGWLESCRVQLTLVRAADTTFVAAQLAPNDAVRLRAFSGSVHFIYADRVGRKDVWVPSWSGSITLPRALGIVAGERDTIVLPVGDRT